MALDAGLTKVVVEVVVEQESTIALFTRLGFRAEALLADHRRIPTVASATSSCSLTAPTTAGSW